MYSGKKRIKSTRPGYLYDLWRRKTLITLINDKTPFQIIIVKDSYFDSCKWPWNKMRSDLLLIQGIL